MNRLAGVANAPCSWGVLEIDLEEEAQGYTHVLDEMAEAGYGGTELGRYGFLPVEPEALREALEARGLALVGALVHVALTEPEARFDGEEMALRAARMLAEVGGETPVVVLSDENGRDPVRTACAGRIAPFQGFSQRQWEAAARTVDRIALLVHEETGLRTVFHPHCAGFVETPEEVEILMGVTHPRLLGLCLDTAHYAYGGGEPVQMVRRYGDRIWHVHFKGYDSGVAEEARLKGWDYFEAVNQGVFCKLPESRTDFAAIVEALEAAEYAGWIVVEQDVLPGAEEPLESAKANRAYLRSLGV